MSKRANNSKAISGAVPRAAQTAYAGRRGFLLFLFGVATIAVACRVFYLQILNTDFLTNQGNARSTRIVAIPAYRGIITDRNGEPLAVSTPVASIWAIPGKVLEATAGLQQLAQLLDIPAETLHRYLSARKDRKFVYLKRQAPPDVTRQVQSLKIPGVNIRKEYKRYYPVGEAASHLIGFTNVDDKGQEGIELAYNDWLQGVPGEKRVLVDVQGSIVKDIESIDQPRPGKPLSLSMDQRLQYLAYRELRSAVLNHGAKSGMLLLLGVRPAETLALAVQPPFNPNNRASIKNSQHRNRVVTDVFEPGSTIKPFTIAAALLSGLYAPETMVDTGPGSLSIGRYSINDVNNYGNLSIADIITKSSNVGTTRVALSLGPERLWTLHDKIGFGSLTDSGYPGEVTGLLTDHNGWSKLDLATISYGYGVSVTALQLARAYSVIASGGLLYPISFTRTDETEPVRRVMPEVVAFEINKMMRTVVEPGGTGWRAAVAGYHVAGKTGTVRKLSDSGYAKDRYISLFAGFAPATRPELVLVVAIDEPRGSQYFGGQVAAPVFASVMRGALRILNIPPDDSAGLKRRTLLVKNTNAGAPR